ncbi:transcriptional regulator [Zymobacter palmae]|uniref:Transcriptional regulator n=2 Tax=Zymobacter palmae TaxID=33074 RepID=A0A348HI00_9GAMM|nr:transcriptional regulator [Zymobacter palmae]
MRCGRCPAPSANNGCTIMHGLRKRLKWDDLRYFLALAESSTVTAASKRLDVSHVTVSRRIEHLETTLSCRLFDRQEHGYRLTERGRSLYEQAQAMREAADELFHALEDDTQGRHTVRISATHSIVHQLLVDALRDVHERYPHLHLDMDISLRNVCIDKRESDIAIRFDDEPAESHRRVCRRLGDVDFVLCCHQDHRERFMAMESTPVITLSPTLREVFDYRYMHECMGRVEPRLSVDSLIVQRDAAIAGYGVALLPRPFLEDSPLVLYSDHVPLRRTLWMVVRADIAQLGPVRHVMDELERCIQMRLSEGYTAA